MCLPLTPSWILSGLRKSPTAWGPNLFCPDPCSHSWLQASHVICHFPNSQPLSSSPFFSINPYPLFSSLLTPSRVLLGTPSQISLLCRWLGKSVQIRVCRVWSNLTVAVDPSLVSQSSFIRNFSDVWGLFLGLVPPMGRQQKQPACWHPSPLLPYSCYPKTLSDFPSLLVLLEIHGISLYSLHKNALENTMTLALKI